MCEGVWECVWLTVSRSDSQVSVSVSCLFSVSCVCEGCVCEGVWERVCLTVLRTESSSNSLNFELRVKYPAPLLGATLPFVDGRLPRSKPDLNARMNRLTGIIVEFDSTGKLIMLMVGRLISISRKVSTGLVPRTHNLLSESATKLSLPGTCSTSNSYSWNVVSHLRTFESLSLSKKDRFLQSVRRVNGRSSRRCLHFLSA